MVAATGARRVRVRGSAAGGLDMARRIGNVSRPLEYLEFDTGSGARDASSNSIGVAPAPARMEAAARKAGGDAERRRPDVARTGCGQSTPPRSETSGGRVSRERLSDG